jgi:hypothetical protein
MKYCILNVFIALFAIPVMAQQSVNASGGDANGAGGTVAYSVGQVVYTTNDSPQGNIAQGVQHAYEIYAVSTEEIGSDLFVLVYPNPTPDVLTVQIDGVNNERISIEIVDLQGKRLRNEQVTESITQMDMSGLPSSTYFIHIVGQQQQKIKTFKVIKN